VIPDVVATRPCASSLAHRCFPEASASSHPPMAAPFNPQIDPTSLSRNQQDLLLAALATNVHPEGEFKPPSRASFDFSAAQTTSPMFASNTFNPAFDDVDFASMDDQQFMDFMGRNGGTDFDAIAPEDTLHEQDSPTSPVLNDGELHDKRKSTEDDDDEENTPKRRESEEKSSKKPGRKPLTSEPTSVSRQPLLAITTNSTRSGRPRIALLNVHSARERKSTCRT
jgi:hypothetical protein